MKKFICIILICLLLPITSIVLAGCKKESYDLKTFYTTYENIVNSTPYLKLTTADNSYNFEIDSQKVNGKKIVIDYEKANHLYSATSSAPYQYIDTLYQQLLDDSLAPMYFFGNKVASSDRVNKDQTKQLFQNLYALEVEYKELDYYVGALNTSLESTSNSTINLSHLKKVFLQYEKLLNAAGNLSSVVSNIYFNTVLSISDFDYSYKKANELTTSDLIKISIDTRAKVYYFKSIYANIYYQMSIKNSPVSDNIISFNATGVSSYQPHVYGSTIESLESKSYDGLIVNTAVVEAIYDNSIALFNIQKTFDKAYSEFNIATSKISYASLSNKISSEEQAYAKTIERFAFGIAYDSYEVLKNLVTLLYY